MLLNQVRDIGHDSKDNNKNKFKSKPKKIRKKISSDGFRKTIHL